MRLIANGAVKPENERIARAFVDALNKGPMTGVLFQYKLIERKFPPKEVISPIAMRGKESKVGPFNAPPEGGQPWLSRA
ncbi:MAG: hypothetical protein HY002_01235 [Candidatus Rokubacteria bacterium]|nr:hypothetical protein [Candidatus Rokubacteria bacterium]